MPRAEKGTPKWLANKMKAKGLQKLRWYCQMCDKQCRDENGFKCHRMSEGHQQQMKVFSQNPDRFMDDFSREFEATFMRLMKTRYCRTRVKANTVYCDMIADKEHIHMNSTIWVTLTAFVHYLGSTGKCKTDLTEKGWFLEYIDRERIKREEDAERSRKADLTLNQMNDRRVKKMVEQAQREGGYQKSEFTPLLRDEGSDNKICLKGFGSVGNKSNNTNKSDNKDESKSIIPKGKNVLLEAFQNHSVVKKDIKLHNNDSNQKSCSINNSKKHKLALTTIMEENEAKKKMNYGNSRYSRGNSKYY